MHNFQAHKIMNKDFPFPFKKEIFFWNIQKVVLIGLEDILKI